MGEMDVTSRERGTGGAQLEPSGERRGADAVHLLSGGILLGDWSGGGIIRDGAVAWSGCTVLETGTREALEARHPRAVRHEARGGWMAPGLINAHHHIYSALAVGLDPGMPMADFRERLDRLWWRLDRALDEASIRVSARVAAFRSIQAGCTTVVDHHASPGVITGVLDVLAEELEEAGLSAVLCYEATDRNSHREALRGLEESARFRDAVRAHPRFRGLMGLHASFTLTDESLARAAELAEGGDIHIHAGEDRLDGEETRGRHGVGPVERLDRFGLLGDRSWIAHGVHLDRAELGLLAERGALLLHNPESNANNQVGRLALGAARAAGVRVALGTDGMSPCVLSAVRSAFLLHRAGEPDTEAGWKEITGLLDGARDSLAALFQQPGYGRLEPGAPADIVVLDPAPAEAVGHASLAAHLVFGMSPPRVRHTIARGAFLLRDFEPVRQDAAKLAREAEPVRGALWDRFRRLAPGTPYLGPDR